MNKRFLTKAALCSLLAVTAACTADDELAGVALPDKGAEGQADVVMNVSDFKFANSGATRTDFVVDDNGANFKWSAGDTVGVFPSENYQTAFPIVEAESYANKHVFNGGSWQLKPSSTYTAYYPFVEQMYLNREAVPVNYLGQNQKGDNTTGHIGKADAMYAKAQIPAQGNVDFNFMHLGCLVMFKVTMPEVVTINSMKLTSTASLFTSEGTFNLNAGTPAVVATKKVSELAYTPKIEVTKPNQVITLFLMVAPTDFVGQNVVMTLTGENGKTYQVENAMPQYNMTAGTAYRTNLTMPVPFDPVAFVTDDANYPVAASVTGAPSIYEGKEVRRRVKSIKIGTKTIDLGSDNYKVNLVDINNKFSVKAGSEIQCEYIHDNSWDWKWMAYFIYVDEDYNGFTGGVTNPTDPSNGGYVPTGDLKSYSDFDFGHDTREGKFWDSKGNPSQLEWCTPAPTFNAPSKPGIYRMRWMVDREVIDPTGKHVNEMLRDYPDEKNHGTIIDVLLEVTE